MATTPNAPITLVESGSATPAAYVAPLSPQVQKRRCCSVKVGGIVLIVLGILFMLIGLFFGAGLPSIIHSKIKTGATTCSNQDIADSFENAHAITDCETCVPFYYNYHPFSIINAQAVLEDPSVKMNVQELGPYVYRKEIIKVEVDISDDVLSYKSYNKWFYEPEKSCSGCSLSDPVIKMDVGILRTLNSVGGEMGMVRAVAAGFDAVVPGSAAIAIASPTFRKNIMRAFYGANSLNPAAMVLAGRQIQAFTTDAQGTFLQFLGSNLFPNEIAFSGIFVTSTVQMAAMGSPGLFAGFATVSAGKRAAAGLAAATGQDPKVICAACSSGPCVAPCAMIKNMNAVVQGYNPLACAAFEKQVAAAAGAPTAQAVVAATCGTCSMENPLALCFAPIPGVIDGNVVQFADMTEKQIEEATKTLPVTLQNTGCGDIAQVADYVQYEGVKENRMWCAQADNGANPSVEQLMRPCVNATIEVVGGSDGASFPFAGANLNGLVEETAFKERTVYVSQARQSLEVFDSGLDVTVRDIPLRRFVVSDTVLDRTSENALKGTGVPVNGVQNLAYNVGLLAYVSFPFFLNGDVQLISDITLKTKEQKVMTKDLLAASNDQYATVLDVHAATGKTMNARKRLMASLAVTKTALGSLFDSSRDDAGVSLAEVIVPVYWGEEEVTITQTVADKLNSVSGLSNSALPVMLVGLILGFIMILVGAYLLWKNRTRSSTVKA